MSNYLNNQGNEYLITDIKDADMIQEARYVLNVALLTTQRKSSFPWNYVW